MADRQGLGSGVAGLATLIEKERTEAAQTGRSVLLVDNGDFLQGTPLADWLSTQKTGNRHPLVASFNALNYDAIGLGNHDLDYSTQYLEHVIAALNAPVICSNLVQSGVRGLGASVIVRRQVETEDGPQEIKIGILSALPRETEIWNKLELPSAASVTDAATCLPNAVSELRAQGADLVVVLAHMGLGHFDTRQTSGDAGARAVSQISGVDAIVAGHTHQRFPIGDEMLSDPSFATPIVMPGAGGSDLGVIDLDLLRDADGQWQVTRQSAQLWAASPETPRDPTVISLSAPAHHAARTDFARCIGQTAVRMHSYFAMLQPSAAMALSARAKAIVVEEALRGTAAQHLPLLATATARAAGGATGLHNYLDIKRGPVLRRQLAGFAPYTNRVCAVNLSGADLRHWLERSAQIYNCPQVDQPHQTLVNDAQPTFIFDAIYGLSYEIDPTQDVGQRISALSYAQAPVVDDQRFVLATNHFRAAGGGGYEHMHIPEPILLTCVTCLTALEEALVSTAFDKWKSYAPWSLKRHGTLNAILETSPMALDILAEIAAFAPKPLGQTDRGFERIQITL